MSLTLGEKLRQAREERGISLSEVAEQTRISSHYLESIENDDYRPLPGGIFNKGFVKSYAKYVELDEQEALLDYSRAISAGEGREEPDLKVYRPEVLTDDRTGSSMIPTVIWAVIILGIMSAAIYFGLNYFRNRPAVVEETPITNVNASGPANANTKPAAPVGSAPDMATLKVEFKATTQPVRLISVSDETKSDNVVAAGSSQSFEPKNSLTLNYNRWNANVVQLTINGKAISLPAVPLEPKSQRIEFTITRDNLPQIWQNGTISTEVPGAVADTAPGSSTSGTPAIQRPTVTRPITNANTVAANAGPKSAESPKTGATPKPGPPKPNVANRP